MMSDHEFVVTMAMDAFRLAMGNKPRTHTAEEIIHWIEMMQTRLKK